MSHHDFIEAVFLRYSGTYRCCVELEEWFEKLTTTYEWNARETFELLWQPLHDTFVIFSIKINWWCQKLAELLVYKATKHLLYLIEEAYQLVQIFRHVDCLASIWNFNFVDKLARFNFRADLSWWEYLTNCCFNKLDLDWSDCLPCLQRWDSCHLLLTVGKMRCKVLSGVHLAALQALDACCVVQSPLVAL